MHFLFLFILLLIQLLIVACTTNCMLIFLKFPICFLVLRIFVTCVYDWTAFNDASVLTSEVAKRDFSSVLSACVAF